MLLSISINNLMIGGISLLLEKNKANSLIELTEDLYLENNFINVHNFWYGLYYVKVYVQSPNNNKAKLNIYNENGKLEKGNFDTETLVENGMRVVNLEKEIISKIKEDNII
ncbi:hypothetical protein MKR28_01460 [Staphylococcus haemolyticus]|uniref:hypothetical protein n=2 Tax=Staphylococcus haemolyticus TaxID=1283 RepID=UPI001F0B29D1|nr:hypothetical protein [Staphylococcus haemolyticus]MCH4459095.1 hypothetical protein [Staphylococcus haemolyticus]